MRATVGVISGRERHLALAAVDKRVGLFVDHFFILGALGFVELRGLENRRVILDIADPLGNLRGRWR